jgi:heavy metal sensor kinase
LKKLSIGLRLTLWYVIVVAVAQLAFGTGMYLILRQSLYSITDEALRDQIDDLTRFLEAQRKNATLAKLQEEVSEAYVLEHSGDYLQVYDERGNWIYRSPAFKTYGIAPIDPRSVPNAYSRDRIWDGHAFRLLTQTIEVNQRKYAVQTALPTDQVLRTLSLFLRYLLLFAPLLLLAAALGGYWLSRKALSPVDLITRTAQQIGGRNLSERLESLETGDELQRLSDTLNAMLSRIETAFLRVNQFTADASHELRTPISLIRTEAEIALRKSRGDAEYREALRHILLESERTSVLVEELLTIARAESGREHMKLTPVDLRKCALVAGNKWRHLMESRDLQFSLIVPEYELMVLADSLAIERLLAILLDNAVKYTPARGTIDLRVGRLNENAVVTVRDNGIGIPQEHHGKIFERFYRVDKARSRDSGGAGIGLSIAECIAEQHGGTITVQSEPDTGSTFVVTLPLKPAVAVLIASPELAAVEK